MLLIIFFYIVPFFYADFRERPFNLKGDCDFFLKKNILIPNVAEKIF
jgi:hypothetical protein